MINFVFIYIKLLNYLIRFSSSRRMPPMPSSRNPQLTRPVKLSKPELHENRESRGRWILDKNQIIFVKKMFFAVAH